MVLVITLCDKDALSSYLYIDNFSYIKDGKFYINNNEHLELTAQYYYQALKDGMSSEEFDKWAFVANYRRIMRLLDPTSLDLSK